MLDGWLDDWLYILLAGGFGDCTADDWQDFFLSLIALLANYHSAVDHGKKQQTLGGSPEEQTRQNNRARV